jgi:HlyD family secretion protein
MNRERAAGPVFGLPPAAGPSPRGRFRTGFAAAAIAAAALAAAGCGGREVAGARAVPVTRGDLQVAITASGTLKTRNSTRIYSELNREGKITFLAPEGSRVRKDDPLVRLDPTEIQREAENVERELTAARGNLDTAKVEARIQESDGKNQVKRADLAVKQAEQDLKKYQEGEAPLQENKLRIALEEARSNQERARAKYEQMPVLREKGFVTASQEEEERIRWEKSKVEHDSARKELDLWQTYTFPMERARKQEAVEQARSELEAVQLRSESQLKQRQGAALQAENAVKNAERQLKEIQEALQKTELRAPTDGLVIYGEAGERRWRQNEEIKVGGRVWRQQVIITLPDPSEMEIEFRVHESDIGKIRLDMKGKVFVETVSDRVFEGTITKIADLANAGDWREDSNVKTFSVEIRLSGKDLGLKPGTSARVEIPVARQENALLIPVSGIHGEPGRFYCFVARGSGSDRRDLSLGLSNEAFAEVVSGLSEGESVLLGPPPKSAPAEPSGAEAGQAKPAGAGAGSSAPAGR